VSTISREGQSQGTDNIAIELFGDHPDEFRRHLLDQNHTENTVGHYLRCIGNLAEMMKAHGIALAELDEAQAVALITKTGWIQKRRIYAAFIAKRFIRFLNERGIAKLPLPRTAKEITRAELKRDYEVYLRRQRGLSERTIFHSWRFADRFLEFRFGEEIGDLSQITSADIVGFLQHLTTRTPPFRDKTPSTHLRNFFRYLFKAGKTATNLALSIPSVAQRYGTRLPRHLIPEQVDILLGAVRTETPRGKRNYAMVLLLARLGLRPPEVIAMQIDDIDWRSGEIIVRGKGARHDRHPLPPDVGEALADYIRLDRRTTSRALPYGITALNDVVWYSESGKNPNTLVRFDPKTETFHTWPIPSGGGVVRNMMPTADGNLVLACSCVNRIALVDVTRR
jgi:integrase/recombinase XerD